jgi:glucan biosynthesis protein C
MSFPSSVTQPGQRLYWIDWLRVLAMASIFFFHNARLFNAGEDRQVKNASTNLGATGLVAFVS